MQNELLINKDCAKSILFLKHIFGSEYKKGISYLSALCCRPTAKLPVLCLSSYFASGKTTFARWVKAMVNDDLKFILRSDLQNTFNYYWAESRVIVLDEFIVRPESLTLIKEFASLNNISIFRQGQYPVSKAFYGKFILLSNNGDALKRSVQDPRNFWVRELSPSTESEHVSYDVLLSELPVFITFLESLQN